MSPRQKTIATVLLIVCAAYLYGRRLGDAPIYVSPDEVIIGVDAHSLATTGHDVHGEWLPLYFKVQMPGEERTGWFTPAIFYFSAIFMKVLPFSESTIRLPTVVVGLSDIVLVYLVARKLFGAGRFSLLAAALLAATPAHFILSRYGLDYLYPLPFILPWLFCLARFVEREEPLMLFFATMCLGAGFYSYISSVLMMPLYFLFTLLVVSPHKRSGYLALVAAAGFCLPLLLFVPWLLKHPTMFADTAQRYALYDSHKLNPLQGLREFLSFQNIDRIASLYWSFFNPSFLFLTGDRQMPFSTRNVGVFAWPVAVLLPFGMYQILCRRRTAINLLVLAGFFTAPLAAVLVPEPSAIIRAVAMLPFGALLATFGAECLWDLRLLARPRVLILPVSAITFLVAMVYAATTIASESRLTRTTVIMAFASVALFAIGWISDRIKQGRAVAICLVALISMQFAAFYRDYFNDYRLRSSPWLGGNLSGALEALIAREHRDRAPLVYFARIRSTSGLLDTSNRWMDAYWRFYLIKHGREDLLERTVPIDAVEVQRMPPGSLVLANEGDQLTGGLVGAGQLRRVALIPEVDRPGFFVILQK